MAEWNPLRDKLAAAKDRVTFSGAELDELVGGLPPFGMTAAPVPAPATKPAPALEPFEFCSGQTHYIRHQRAAGADDCVPASSDDEVSAENVRHRSGKSNRRYQHPRVDAGARSRVRSMSGLHWTRSPH